MNKITPYLIAILLLTGFSVSAKNNLSIKPSVIYNLEGYTAYRIGGRSQAITPTGTIYKTHRFPISELLFYTDTELFGGTIEWWPFKQLLVSLSAYSTPGYQTVSSFEDRDWGAEFLLIDATADPNVLNIFSTTESKLKSRLFQWELLYKKQLTPSFFVTIGNRNELKHHHFRGSNTLETVTISTGTSQHFASGETITYDQNTLSSFLVMGATYQGEIYGLNIEGAYSPFTSVTDEDIHILREKYNYNDTNGVSTQFKVGATVKTSPIVTWYIQYATYFLKTDGIQTQIFKRATTYHRINTSIESHQQSVQLGVKIDV